DMVVDADLVNQIATTLGGSVDYDLENDVDDGLVQVIAAELVKLTAAMPGMDVDAGLVNQIATTLGGTSAASLVKRLVAEVARIVTAEQINQTADTLVVVVNVGLVNNPAITEGRISSADLVKQTVDEPAMGAYAELANQIAIVLARGAVAGQEKETDTVSDQENDQISSDNARESIEVTIIIVPEMRVNVVMEGVYSDRQDALNAVSVSIDAHNVINIVYGEYVVYSEVIVRNACVVIIIYVDCISVTLESLDETKSIAQGLDSDDNDKAATSETESKAVSETVISGHELDQISSVQGITRDSNAVEPLITSEISSEDGRVTLSRRDSDKGETVESTDSSIDNTGNIEAGAIAVSTEIGIVLTVIEQIVKRVISELDVRSYSISVDEVSEGTVTVVIGADDVQVAGGTERVLEENAETEGVKALDVISVNVENGAFAKDSGSVGSRNTEDTSREMRSVRITTVISADNSVVRNATSETESKAVSETVISGHELDQISSVYVYDDYKQCESKTDSAEINSRFNYIRIIMSRVFRIVKTIRCSIDNTGNIDADTITVSTESVMVLSVIERRVKRVISELDVRSYSVSVDEGTVNVVISTDNVLIADGAERVLEEYAETEGVKSLDVVSENVENKAISVSSIDDQDVNQVLESVSYEIIENVDTIGRVINLDASQDINDVSKPRLYQAKESDKSRIKFVKIVLGRLFRRVSKINEHITKIIQQIRTLVAQTDSTGASPVSSESRGEAKDSNILRTTSVVTVISVAIVLSLSIQPANITGASIGVAIVFVLTLLTNVIQANAPNASIPTLNNLRTINKDLMSKIRVNITRIYRQVFVFITQTVNSIITTIYEAVQTQGERKWFALTQESEKAQILHLSTSFKFLDFNVSLVQRVQEIRKKLKSMLSSISKAAYSLAMALKEHGTRFIVRAAQLFTHSLSKLSRTRMFRATPQRRSVFSIRTLATTVVFFFVTASPALAAETTVAVQGTTTILSALTGNILPILVMAALGFIVSIIVDKFFRTQDKEDQKVSNKDLIKRSSLIAIATLIFAIALKQLPVIGDTLQVIMGDNDLTLAGHIIAVLKIFGISGALMYGLGVIKIGLQRIRNAQPVRLIYGVSELTNKERRAIKRVFTRQYQPKQESLLGALLTPFATKQNRKWAMIRSVAGAILGGFVTSGSVAIILSSTVMLTHVLIGAVIGFFLPYLLFVTWNFFLSKVEKAVALSDFARAYKEDTLDIITKEAIEYEKTKLVQEKYHTGRIRRFFSYTIPEVMTRFETTFPTLYGILGFWFSRGTVWMISRLGVQLLLAMFGILPQTSILLIIAMEIASTLLTAMGLQILRFSSLFSMHQDRQVSDGLKTLEARKLYSIVTEETKIRGLIQQLDDIGFKQDDKSKRAKQRIVTKLRVLYALTEEDVKAIKKLISDDQDICVTVASMIKDGAIRSRGYPGLVKMLTTELGVTGGDKFTWRYNVRPALQMMGAWITSVVMILPYMVGFIAYIFKDGLTADQQEIETNMREYNQELLAENSAMATWKWYGGQLITSAFHLSLIGLEIDMVVGGAEALTHIPVIKHIGEPIHEVAEALEGPHGIINWGQATVDVIESAADIRISNAIYEAITGEDMIVYELATMAKEYSIQNVNRVPDGIQVVTNEEAFQMARKSWAVYNKPDIDFEESIQSAREHIWMSSLQNFIEQLNQKAVEQREQEEQLSENEEQQSGDETSDDHEAPASGDDADVDGSIGNLQAGARITFKRPIDLDQAMVTSGFGMRYHPIKKEVIMHYGTDFAGVPVGTAIQSIHDGQVIAIDKNGYRYIDIDHGIIDGRHYISRYGHIGSSLPVKLGDKVEAGQTIAYIGPTDAYSTGPHLHLEMKVDSNIADGKDEFKYVNALHFIRGLTVRENVVNQVYLGMPRAVKSATDKAIDQMWAENTELLQNTVWYKANFAKLIREIMWQESRFKYVTSNKGAKGWMQIMPESTWPGIAEHFGWAKDDYKDVDKNILGGTWYFVNRLRGFKDVELALSSYNAGPAATYVAIARGLIEKAEEDPLARAFLDKNSALETSVTTLLADLNTNYAARQPEVRTLRNLRASLEGEEAKTVIDEERITSLQTQIESQREKLKPMYEELLSLRGKIRKAIVINDVIAKAQISGDDIREFIPGETQGYITHIMSRFGRGIYYEKEYRTREDIRRRTAYETVRYQEGLVGVDLGDDVDWEEILEQYRLALDYMTDPQAYSNREIARVERESDRIAAPIFDVLITERSQYEGLYQARYVKDGEGGYLLEEMPSAYMIYLLEDGETLGAMTEKGEELITKYIPTDILDQAKDIIKKHAIEGRTGLLQGSVLAITPTAGSMRLKDIEDMQKNFIFAIASRYEGRSPFDFIMPHLGTTPLHANLTANDKVDMGDYIGRMIKGYKALVEQGTDYFGPVLADEAMTISSIVVEAEGLKVTVITGSGNDVKEEVLPRLFVALNGEEGTILSAGELVGLVAKSEYPIIVENEDGLTPEQLARKRLEEMQTAMIERQAEINKAREAVLTVSVDEEELLAKLESAQLGRVEAAIQEQMTKPSDVIEAFIHSRKELNTTDKDKLRVMLYAGLNFTPQNGYEFANIELSDNLAFNLGLMIDHRYAQILNMVQMGLGFEDFLQSTGLEAALGYIAYAEAASTLINMFEQERLGISDGSMFGYRYDLSEKAFFHPSRVLVDISKIVTDPRFVELTAEEQAQIRALGQDLTDDHIVRDEKTGIVTNLPIAKLLKDIPRKTLGRIPVIGKLFGDPELAAIWDKQYPIYIPGKAMLEFSKEAIENMNENYIYTTHRGWNGQPVMIDGTEYPSNEFIFGIRYDIVKGEAKVAFISHVFAKGKDGRDILAQWRSQPENAIFRLDEGQFYIVPSKHTLSQAEQLHKVMRGEDGILAAAIHPITGSIIRIFTDRTGLPSATDLLNGQQVKFYERTGQFIYTGASGDLKQSANIHPAISLGMVDGEHVYPYIIGSQYNADLYYWMYSETTDEETAHIIVVDKYDSSKARVIPYTGDIEDIETKASVYDTYKDRDDIPAAIREHAFYDPVAKEYKVRQEISMWSPDRLTAEGQKGAWKDIVIPENLNVVTDSRYVEDGEFGLIIPKPERIPVALAILPWGSFYLYSQQDINRLVTKDAGGELNVEQLWVTAEGEVASRYTQIDANNPKHRNIKVILAGRGLDTSDRLNPEVGILEFGVNMPDYITEMIERKAEAVIIQENGDAEYLIEGETQSALVKEIIAHVPEDRVAALTKALRSTRAQFGNVDDVLSLIKAAGVNIDFDQDQVQTLVNLRQAVESAKQEYLLGRKESELIEKQLKRLEGYNGDSFRLRARAVNAMLQHFAESRAKDKAGLYLESIFAEIAGAKDENDPAIDELKQQLRDATADGTSMGDAIRNLIMEAFSGSFIKGSDIAALEAELALINQALTLIRNLKNADGT
ncbi:MAG: peptidoglycan DD-metalloendopeptidase family protein, partial [Candidatus Omnitrophica bacterium]|nr:peptidoglycan DD-metalloendopeptidase family protein [Candidatus Omnitrophota bacterium]